MGVEDYAVTLRPLVGEPSFTAVEQRLFDLGFARDAPGHSGRPFTNERTYTLDDGNHILEALIESPSDPVTDHSLASDISIRFAICQPIAVTTSFFNVVHQLSTTFDMDILYNKPAYTLEEFESFQHSAPQQVHRLKNNWRTIFEGDAEELKLSVGMAWPHFMKKHPHLFYRR